ncbi:hypothetical protein KAK06_21930 [Ideonella sp. 4Y11]|uniref:Tail specific protease domain-containing protein n=1 Tax=Ideonella aquatica TaxID=2824119 RepID=A0A940YYR8_9BURK|nr:S41 family peptidase [Ideonella aquatica]MBQ0961615.1 hypothetical protein [Ideonella aquatica]
MRRRTLLSALAGTTATAGWAADPPLADLAGDADIVAEVLTTLHPGALRYHDAASLAAVLQQFRRAFTAPEADAAARYLALARALATLRCGHSFANPANQSRRVAQALFDRPTRLPLRFRWLDGQMVVLPSPLQPDVAPGSVIEAIDGLAPDDWWRRLAPLARVDGHNLGKARRQLSLEEVEGQWPLFDVLQGLLIGGPASGAWRLQLRTPQGRQTTVALPAWSGEQRRAQASAGAPAPSATPWTWTVRPDGVVLLRMPTWAVYNSRWDWQGWLNERLDELAADRAARGLVIDLRGNEGGLDCGHPVIERLARAPSLLPQRRLVRYRRTPAHLNPVLDTWDDSFRDWGEAARPVDERFLALPPGPTTVAPRGARVTQPMAVLVDASNSSATFGFAQRVRQDRLGQLVGEPTGGNLRGINGGAFFFVRLPASGLSFDLPLIGYYPPEGAPLPEDAGLQPDHRVTPSLADIAAGRDVALERALALLTQA